MGNFKKKLITVLRWFFFLPGAAACSYLVYLLFVWLNKSNEYPHTNIDSLWDFLIVFTGHLIMGLTFVYIGTVIAPSWRKTCAICLFGIACVLIGVVIFANILNGFSWYSFVCALCVLGGAGFGLFLLFNEKDKIID